MAKSLLYSSDRDPAAAAAFIARLLHSVTGAHMLHLASHSYAQHMALGALYEGLGDLADTIAEEYMGCYGQIMTYPCACPDPGSDAIAYVTGLYAYIDSVRGVMGSESHIQNNIDSVQTLISGTLYKLKFLS